MIGHGRPMGCEYAAELAEQREPGPVALAAAEAEAERLASGGGPRLSLVEVYSIAYRVEYARRLRHIRAAHRKRGRLSV